MLNIRDNNKAERGFAIAAIIQAMPPAFSYFLVGWISFFMLVVMGLNFGQLPAFFARVLWWLTAILIATGVLAGIAVSMWVHNKYHEIVMKVQERRAAKEKNRKLFLQNEVLVAKVEMERQLPSVLKYAMDQGKNAKYGGLEVTDWRSNMHMLQGSQVDEVPPKQVQGPMTRMSIAECIESVEPNSLKVCVGNVVDSTEKAVLSFKKTHFKVIGASQKGKSSLVATILKVISETHTPDVVQFAILDMEDMTGNLFRDNPHVMIHARTKEDVVIGLRKCVSIMEARYKMPVALIAKQSIILIYVEEFLDLKNQLKAFQIDLYKELVAHINTLATRGLKARCQLLLCAQTEYRDGGGELAGALCNIPNGFSVCLKPDAARAAGFVNTDLLNRNYRENKVGVFVVSHPQLQGIVVGADMPLEQQLTELEEEEYADEYEDDTEVIEQDAPVLLPQWKKKGPQADDIDINEAVTYWNNGHDSEDKLMKVYPGLTKYQANKLYHRIKRLYESVDTSDRVSSIRPFSHSEG